MQQLALERREPEWSPHTEPACALSQPIGFRRSWTITPYAR
jgi:hypothetical protein